MSKRLLLLALIGAFVLLVGSVPAMAAIPSLQGSWRFTLTPATPTPSAQIPGLVTFTSDGSLIETDGSELTAISATTGATPSSPGHGVWQLGPSMTFYYVQYDSITVAANGALISTNQTTMTLTMSSTGQNFSGSYTTSTINPQGMVLKTVSGSVTGVLIPHPALP